MPLTRAAALMGAVVIAAGCASSGTPVSTVEISRTEDAIRSAENAQAAQDARELLDRSHTALAAARREWQADRFDRARRYLEEADAAARAALARCRAVQQERQVADARREVQDLERQVRELSLQLQKP